MSKARHPKTPKLPTPKAGTIGATGQRLGDTQPNIAERVAARLRRASR